MKSSRPIPLCVPELRGNERRYLGECLDTNFVSSAGPFVERFERLAARYLGVSGAAAVMNGTSALHLALLLAGVEPEDEVLVSTFAFIAPANTVRYVRAHPVFMDAEPDYWQMDVQKAADFLAKECQWKRGALRNRKTGRRVKAILPVHVLGHPCDMDPLLHLARKYELKVIEDAAESFGAEYKKKKVGSLGDIACLSFNGNKLVTSGGGGMIVTRNQKWIRRARYLSTQAKDSAEEYIHKEAGYNYRLTNLQAAVGCAQMEKAGEFIAAKRAIAARYTQAFSGYPEITPMREAPWARSAFWMYTLLIHRSGKKGLSSRGLMRRFAENGMQTRPLWQPLHQSVPYRECQAYKCEVSQRLYRESLALPCSSGLKIGQQRRVIACLKKSLGI